MIDLQISNHSLAIKAKTLPTIYKLVRCAINKSTINDRPCFKLFYLIECTAEVENTFSEFLKRNELIMLEPPQVLFNAMQFIIELDKNERYTSFPRDLNQFINEYGQAKYSQLEKCCSARLLSLKSFALLSNSIEYTLKLKMDLSNFDKSSPFTEQLEAKYIIYLLLTAQSSHYVRKISPNSICSFAPWILTT